MVDGLRRNGVEVLECHVTLWHGVSDRVATVEGGWLHPAFLVRLVRAYAGLLRKYRQVGDYDVMIVGYPGQLDIYLARLLTWLRRKPLVLDVFMSLHLIATERGLVGRHPLAGWLLQCIERLAYRLPDLLLQDTRAYVDWLCTTYGLRPERFRLVPTGADDSIFSPSEVGRHAEAPSFLVLYWGTFIPNHGVEYMIEAARVLRDQTDISFELIGDGPSREDAVRLAQAYQLTNVVFLGFLDRESINTRAARADLCLGVFGTTPQSMMTVQNKLYECMAMAKPLISGDSPTMRAQFEHGREVYLVERESPEALASAIMTLYHNAELRQSLSMHGYQSFASQYAPKALGRQTMGHLQVLLP